MIAERGAMARKLAISIFFGLPLAFSFLVAAPSVARDRVGLVDLHGTEIIPCKYLSMHSVGCGFYLAKEDPTSSKQPSGMEILSNVPRKLLARIEDHDLFEPKILLTRNGKKVKLPIPKGLWLTDAYLPSRDFTEENHKIVNPKCIMPPDAMFAVIGKDGFGVCNAKGEVVILPNVKMLEKEEFFATFALHSQIAKPVSRQERKQQTYEKELPREYSEGLGVFCDEHLKHGYMNERGDVVIPAKYDRASMFRDGVAAVCEDWRSDKFVFIDKDGKVVSPTYGYATSFSHGIAKVGKGPWHQQLPNNFYFVNRKFERISPFYSEANTFSDGTALVKDRTSLSPDNASKNFFFVNQNFEQVSPRYDKAREFNGEVALVTLKNANEAEVGFIDRNFKYTFVCKGDRKYFFLKGYWVIQQRNCPAIVLHGTGKEFFRTKLPAFAFELGGSPFEFESYDRKRMFIYDEHGQLKEDLGELGGLELGRLPLGLKIRGHDWDSVNGIRGKAGWLIPPEEAKFKICEFDRVVKQKYGKFCKEDWMKQNDIRDSEIDSWLREHDPIGMSKSEVHAALGVGQPKKEYNTFTHEDYDCPSVETYQLTGFGSLCGNSKNYVDFQYHDSKVVRWRFYNKTHPSNPWNSFGSMVHGKHREWG